MFKNKSWLNEPQEFRAANNSLWVKTADKTDFWQKTFYGFQRDDGHFLYEKVTGDFTLQVTFVGKYEELYDQAGLMIRVDQSNWLKTGIEYTDGAMHLSAVVTRDYSDWSVVRLSKYSGSMTMRVSRQGEAVRIEYLDEDQKWQMLRLCYLAMPKECLAGIMCCSPQRAGFEVEFRDYRLTDVIVPDLHG